MSSPYDALLDSPGSRYDALLTEPANPKGDSPYDVLLDQPASDAPAQDEAQTNLENYLLTKDEMRAKFPNLDESGLMAKRQEFQKAYDTLHPVLSSGKPVVPLPKPENKGPVSGTVRGLLNIAEGIETPDTLMTIAAAAVAPEAVAPLISGYFAADTLSHVPEQYKAVKDAKTIGGKFEKGTEMAGGLLVAGLATGHSVKGAKTVVRQIRSELAPLTSNALDVTKPAHEPAISNPSGSSEGSPAQRQAEPGGSGNLQTGGGLPAEGRDAAQLSEAPVGQQLGSAAAPALPEPAQLAPLTTKAVESPGKVTQLLNQRQKVTDPAERQRLWDEAQAALKDEPTVAERVPDKPGEPVPDWTSATEESPSEMKKSSSEGGFANLEVFEDFARSIYKKGMELAQWSKAMLARFGEFIRPYLSELWRRMQSEEGALFGGGGMKMKSKEAGAINIPKFANRKMSELDAATAAHSAKLQKSFDEARRAQTEIKKAVPKEDRQNAISVWMEADGDAAKLSGWEAGAKQPWFKKAARDAQTLTPEETAIAKKAQSAFDVLEKRGNHYDVLGSHRDNYVPHVWDVKPPGSGFGGRRLQERFKFNKARTFDTFADGDQADFKPKTLAIGNLLPTYISEINKVIADRQFVQDVASHNAIDGTPLASPRGNVTVVDSGASKAVLVQPRATREADTGHYRTMSDQPALSNWTWEGKDTDGNPIFVKADLALHPEAYKRLQAILGKSAIREWYNEESTGFARIPRAIVKGLDTAQSAMKREMFGLLPPFHQVQEGTHAIGHSVNPFYNIPKLDLRNPAQMDAARHGLMMLPDRTSSARYLEGVGADRTLVTQALRKFGKLGAESLANVIDGYQDYLFHHYIPGLKFKTYEAIRGRNMKLYADELTKGTLTEADVKLLSAEQTNAAYGHLNYSLLDTNPTMQHLKQLVLLAPDFLEARSRFVANATKGMLGSKVGVEQFSAIAKLALIQAGVSLILSQLTDGEWDPKHPFEFTKNGRRYSMRSVPEDIASLITDTRKFIYGRINPLTAKGAIQLGTGLNYRGEKVTALDTLEELLAQYIPITIRSAPGLRELNNTTKNSPTSPLEQLAGSLGLRISRYSPIGETFKSAHEWMKKEGIPEDKGSYPVSKYQQLRYALEDGDDAKAKAEYEKLRKTMSSDKLSTGFHESINHPFTQNRSMDARFRKSLSGKDASLYDLAQKKRSEIIQRFAQLK